MSRTYRQPKVPFRKKVKRRKEKKVRAVIKPGVTGRKGRREMRALREIVRDVLERNAPYADLPYENPYTD